jgi:phosphoglycerate-specific signal transduction histidine kinase
LQQAGERPDPWDAQITRLKNEVAALKQRLVESTTRIDEFIEFRTQALAQLAAQHDEITRRRASTAAASRVRRLPPRATSIDTPR